mmetsp:Transcript_45189/g.90246  ORF Transcript_45189/g.90246 Transcript_45189/m.90246 type:complete len:264 (+) Transcript_45189:1123-1914(+)
MSPLCTKSLWRRGRPRARSCCSSSHGSTRCCRSGAPTFLRAGPNSTSSRPPTFALQQTSATRPLASRRARPTGSPSTACSARLSTAAESTTRRTNGCCTPTSSSTFRRRCSRLAPAARSGSPLASRCPRRARTQTTWRSSRSCPRRTHPRSLACQPTQMSPCSSDRPFTSSRRCARWALIPTPRRASTVRSGPHSSHRSSHCGSSLPRSASRCATRRLASLTPRSASPSTRSSLLRSTRPSCCSSWSTSRRGPSAASCAALSC